MEYIDKAIKDLENKGEAEVNCITTKYLLVDVHHYSNLV